MLPPVINLGSRTTRRLSKPVRLWLKVVHIERVPGMKISMILRTLPLGKLKPMPPPVTNIGLKRTKQLKREVKSSCRQLNHSATLIHTANGAMIQIDSLLGMMIKLMR